MMSKLKIFKIIIKAINHGELKLFKFKQNMILKPQQQS